MQFNVNSFAPNSKARTGVITTDHGTIPTPIFMPVGTVGSVKGVNHRDLENDVDAKIIFYKIFNR